MQDEELNIERGRPELPGLRASQSHEPARGGAGWRCQAGELHSESLFSSILGSFGYVLRRRWRLFAVVTLLTAAAGCFWGYQQSGYTAIVRLVCSPPADSAAGTEEAIGLSFFTSRTLADALGSSRFGRQKAEWPGFFLSRLVPADADKSGEAKAMDLVVSGPDREGAVEFANACGQEAVRYAGEMKRIEAEERRQLFQERLATVDRKLEVVSERLREFRRRTGLLDLDKESAAYAQKHAELAVETEDARLQLAVLDLQVQALGDEIARRNPALVETLQKLDEALLHYTEEHPEVKKLRAALDAFHSRNSELVREPGSLAVSEGDSLAGGLYHKMVDLRTRRLGLQTQIDEGSRIRSELKEKMAGLSEQALEYASLKSDLESLQQMRQMVADRHHAAGLIAANAGNYCRLLRPAEIGEVDRFERVRNAAWWALLSGILGAGLCLLTSAFVGSSNRPVRNREDLCRATALPFLADLGDVRKLSATEEEDWAIRTFLSLKAGLKQAPGEALICGFISAHAGEGRSTWIRLLARAARKQGYRVLTVGPPAGVEGLTVDSTPARKESGARADALAPLHGLAAALHGSDTQRVSSVAWPEGIWNWRCRKQWHEALRQAARMEDLVLFVQFPPASTAEALLLVEGFPAVIWVCGEGVTGFKETRFCLERLRQAGGQVVATALNRSRKGGARRSAARISARLLCLGLSFASAAGWAQAPAGGQPPPPGSSMEQYLGPMPSVAPLTIRPRFSASSPEQLAEWQMRLTIGPGDVLDVSLYEQPNSVRPGLVIGPDGRINYLQARDVMAAGLTVDELRDRLEAALARFYLAPRVVVTPVAYNSKKYYLLGNVIQKGVFPLDRPITVLEAIARAHGFIHVAQQRNTLMAADLSRSFLIRKEESGSFNRVGIDFEALFLHGDLGQNVLLAPDDYLYFPPLDQQDVFILGEVAQPGPAAYSSAWTVLRAIVARGGLTERAFKQRVLVVRGSLNRPETFVVNLDQILRAGAADFILKPGDIIYVNRKPWAKAQELLEAAIMDFTRAAIITYTGQEVGPFIIEPLVK